MKGAIIGKQDFGTWKDGSSVFKDKRGFFVVQWNPKKNEEFKKYLKNWKPKQTSEKSVLKNNIWVIVKSTKKTARKPTKKPTKKQNKSTKRKTRKLVKGKQRTYYITICSRLKL